MLTKIFTFKASLKLSVKEDILKNLKNSKSTVFINYVKGKCNNYFTIMLTIDCHKDKIRMEQIPN